MKKDHSGNPFGNYLAQVQQSYSAGNATEHTYRSMLERLIESLDTDLRATNEPRRIACGAPDYIVTRRSVPLGYVEAKDIGHDLDKTETEPQLVRYRASLANLILTDYLEFRWYVEGTLRLTARLATIPKSGKLRALATGTSDVTQLLNGFLRYDITVIKSPKDLAVRMAGLAQLIREIIRRTFSAEGERGPLHVQLEGFQKVLVHDMTPDQFGDMYAQTICYGLFAARCNHVGKGFGRANAAFDLPKTNPFLRRLFGHIAGPELDERIVWAVDDLAEVLNRTDISTILKDFGKRTRQEDPVVHFYETFLAAYDSALREARGVYYTPEPVVSYITHSIDHILRTDFKLPDGLADAKKIKLKQGKKSIETHQVQILDPATGTGTFLFSVIDIIAERFRGNRGLWSAYVSEHLLPRIFGFELLIAPYAVAHMKLGLQLKDLGYDFKSDERLRVYVTNTLEGAHEMAGLPLFAQWLAEEANSASSIKRDLPIMVILGNPPYSGVSENADPWIELLMKDYKVTVQDEERQIQRLSNDYVKFIRFAHWRLVETGSGVLGFITDRGYLDGILFRDMRSALMADFSDIYIYDLHGVAVRGASRAGDNDKNVFDITQGVAIALFVRRPATTRRMGAKVHYAELRGPRALKYEVLSTTDVSTTNWLSLDPKAPNWYFVPVQEDSAYESWPSFLEFIGTGKPKLDRDSRYGTGIKTRHDAFVIGWSDEDAVSRVKQVANRDESDAELVKSLGLCTTAHFDIKKARARAERDDLSSYIKPIAFRPFDTRKIVYLREFVCEPKAQTMAHLLRPNNLALAILRKDRKAHATGYFVGRGLIAKDFVSNIDDALIWPLYVYSEDPGQQQTIEMAAHDAGQPNLSPYAIATFSRATALWFNPAGKGNLRESFGPEDVLHYIYAVLYAPTYRSRYDGFLMLDYPRIPIPPDAATFGKMCELGQRLVSLHLLERLSPVVTSYPNSGDNAVTSIEYISPTTNIEGGRIYINKTQYFGGVPESVWNYRIGAYQVCEKWLKDRRNRKLTYDDLTHYQRIIATLLETILIQSELDDAYQKWQ